jgi:hypothetical protein
MAIEIVNTWMTFGDYYIEERQEKDFKKDRVKYIDKLIKYFILRENLRRYMKCPRMVIIENGDQIKYDEGGKIE